MAFWHYDPDRVTTDRSVQPIDRIRRSAYDEGKIRLPRRPDGHAAPDDFEASQAAAAYKHQRKKTSKPTLAVRAEQIMSAPVVSIEPDAGLNELKQLVKERRFRHIPVIAGSGLICGIVSDRDLLALPTGDGPEETLEHGVVSDIMTQKVLTATPDTNIREIARVLFEERIGCMPIVDDDKQVVGVITRSDILRALIKHAPLDLWI